MLYIYHAGLLVKAAVYSRCLSRVVETGTLVAVCVGAVLVADIHHVLKLMRAAEDA